VRERIDAIGAEALELGAARAEQLGKPVVFPAHREEAT
jgi:TPP-dependent pyruvate/acetoin dehydrogenase alpha subunit